MTKNEKVIEKYERKYKLDKPRLVKPFGSGGAHIFVPKEHINKFITIREINNKFELNEQVKSVGNGAHVIVPKKYIGELFVIQKVLK